MLVLSIALTSCGGGGSSGSAPAGGGPPPVVATAPPAGATAGDVRGVASLPASPTVAFDDDDQTLFVAEGPAFVTYGGSFSIALPPADTSPYITSAVYSHSARALYFAGFTSIYRATTNGVVSTVGTGFGLISGIALDANGAVYAVDGDHVSTVAGGVAKPLTPAGTVNTNEVGVTVAAPQLTYDSHDGALYLTDPFDSSIKRVTTTGSVSVVAGTCIPYFMELETCWPQMTPGTGASAHFGRPSGIAYDAASDLLYVGDAYDNVVWAVTPSGTSSIAAGYGTFGLADGNGRRAFLVPPEALSLSASGTLYMDEVDQFDDTTEIATFATTGNAPQPYTFPTIEFPTPTQPSFPQGLAGAPDGSVWITEAYGQKIGHITSAGVTEYPVPAGFNGPFKITVAADGSAWATAQTALLSGAIISVSPSGTAKGYAFTSGGMPVTIDAIATGPDGNPWFSYFVGATPAGSIKSIDRSSGIVSDHPIGTQLARALATGPDGNIWFATNNGTGALVDKMAPSGQLVGQPFAVKSTPVQMVANPVDHSLWYIDDAYTLGRIDENDVETDTLLCTVCAADPEPGGVAVAPDGSIWFTEENPSDIGHRDTSGTITRYLLPAPNPAPSELAVRSDGKVWVATNFGTIYLFDAAAYDALGIPHAVGNAGARRSPHVIDRRALYGHAAARPVRPQSHRPVRY